MNKSIKEEVKKVICNILRINILSINDNTSFTKDLCIDNFQILQIISAINNTFNAEINEIEIYNIDNILDIVDIIYEYKGTYLDYY
jgi:acyl carrier protein